MDKLHLRDARESDLPKIVEIYNSTIPSRVVSADTEPVTIEQRTGWFHEHDPHRRPLWVAELDGTVVGWLSLGDFWDRRPAYNATAEVGIYVKDSHRGRGIGRRLIKEAVERAPSLGIETLTAGAFAHNEASLALFKRFGFERWAHFPEVAELDGVKRDLVVLGLMVGKQNRASREHWRTICPCFKLRTPDSPGTWKHSVSDDPPFTGRRPPSLIQTTACGRMD